MKGYDLDNIVMEGNILEKISKAKDKLKESIKDSFKISFTSLENIEKDLINIKDQLNGLKNKTVKPSLSEILVSESTYRNLCCNNKVDSITNELIKLNNVIKNQSVLGITRFLGKEVLPTLRTIVDNTYLSGGRFKPNKNIVTFYKEVDNILNIDNLTKKYISKTYPKPIHAPSDLVHKNIGFKQPGGSGVDLIDPSDYLGCKRVAIHMSTPPNKGNNVMYIWEHLIELYPFKAPNDLNIKTMNANELLNLIDISLKLITSIKSFDKRKTEIRNEGIAAINLAIQISSDVYADDENRTKNGPLQTFLFMFYWDIAPFFIPLGDILNQAEKSIYAAHTLIDKNSKLLIQ